MLPLVVALAALGLGAPHPTLGCSECMCGTPFPSGTLGGVVPAQLTYGFEERYLSKSNALDDAPGRESEHEYRVAGYVLWRPLDRLALQGRLPYVFKTLREDPAADATTTETTSGLGDAQALAMLGLVRGSGLRALSLGLVVGGSAPTGSNDLTGPDGERLEAHLQPGLGAWSGTAGLAASVGAHSGLWDASVLWRTSGTSPHGYRYGDVLLYNAGFTSHPRGGLQGLLEVNGRVARRDRLEDGTSGSNTGGAVTYLAPGLRWRTPVALVVEAGVQVPIAQSLFGDQTEHATARLSIGIDR